MIVKAGLEVSLRDQANIPLDAEISCRPGELLALVGPSGSGKSTILRTIAGLNPPQWGIVSCNGNTWLDTDKGINVPTRHRRVGMVFQNYALFPHLSARDNIIEGLGHVAGADRHKRAEDLLSLVHLSGLGERLPQALSGGQQQRVAVARALARDPQVLLLDEPFSAVDQATRQRLYREIVELRNLLGMPMVLVTHDLDEATMLADRLCILRRGRTLQSGPPYDVLARPVNKEVARLVDQKNVFQGTVIGHEEALGITSISWGDITLQAPYQPGFKAGRVIDWMIPTSHVAPVCDDENVVLGEVSAIVRLGDLVTVSLIVKEASSHPLFMSLPLREAQQRNLNVGGQLSVSLIATGIHLMEPLKA